MKKPKKKEELPPADNYIWSRVIDATKLDLRSKNEKTALIAARYFFVRGCKRDKHNMKTFTGLCAAWGIDPDAGAETIFRQLEFHEQIRICMLLKNTGYNIRKDLLPTATIDAAV